MKIGARMMGRLSTLVLVLIVGLFLFSTANASAQNLEFATSDSDGTCPAGFQLATPDEARGNTSGACSVLGTWYIARLAGGGSMDGPGYGCQIRAIDNRGLGNSLCRRSDAPAKFVASDSDGVCPSGYVLTSPSEARAQREQACAVLGPWYIARLAGGGSMDGSGYACKIRDIDQRGLGNSLCRLGDAAQYGETSVCISDALSSARETSSDSASWLIGGQTFAVRSNFSHLQDGFANQDFANEAARNYCTELGYAWALPQLKLDGAEPHLDVQCCSLLNQHNSTIDGTITAFVNEVTSSQSAQINEITKAESLADIFLLGKSIGRPLTQDQLSAIAQAAKGTSTRSAPCGGWNQPACSKCNSLATVYFPFNFCCVPMATQCLEESTVGHCDPGLTPTTKDLAGFAAEVCDIDRRNWPNTSIDRTRTGPGCGGSQPKSCWQLDDQDRDTLVLDTAQLNFVTTLGPQAPALPPTGTRFIYVYRKQDNSIVLRNFDRSENDRSYMYPGNCVRRALGPVAYKCSAGAITNGDYAHVRHTQLNHAPNTPVGNNWDDVWCAGEMRIEDGEICLINNESGHFKPRAECTARVLLTLKAWGVRTSDWLMHGNFDKYSAARTCKQTRDEL